MSIKPDISHLLGGAPVCDRLFALATPQKPVADRRSTLSRFCAECELSKLDR